MSRNLRSPEQSKGWLRKGLDMVSNLVPESVKRWMGQYRSRALAILAVAGVSSPAVARTWTAPVDVPGASDQLQHNENPTVNARGDLIYDHIDGGVWTMKVVPAGTTTAVDVNTQGATYWNPESDGNDVLVLDGLGNVWRISPTSSDWSTTNVAMERPALSFTPYLAGAFTVEGGAYYYPTDNPITNFDIVVEGSTTPLTAYPGQELYPDVDGSDLYFSRGSCEWSGVAPCDVWVKDMVSGADQMVIADAQSIHVSGSTVYVSRLNAHGYYSIATMTEIVAVPTDTDGDGVVDDLDQCEGTPLDPAHVDADGCTDADEDGYSVELGGDCDDADSDTYPGAMDIFDNGKNEDCNDTYPRAATEVVNFADLSVTTSGNPAIVSPGAIEVRGAATDDVGATLTWVIENLNTGEVIDYQGPVANFESNPEPGTSVRFSARCILSDGINPDIDETRYFTVVAPELPTTPLEGFTGDPDGETLTGEDGGTLTGEGVQLASGQPAEVGDGGWIDLDGVDLQDGIDFPDSGMFLECTSEDPAECSAQAEALTEEMVRDILLAVSEDGGQQAARVSYDYQIPEMAAFDRYLDDVRAAGVTVFRGEWRLRGKHDVDITLSAGDKVIASDTKDSSGYSNPMSPGVDSVDGGTDGETDPTGCGCVTYKEGPAKTMIFTIPLILLTGMLRRRQPKIATARRAS